MESLNGLPILEKYNTLESGNEKHFIFRFYYKDFFWNS